LRERQKLESIGILAGGVAHDFNNLLVGVLGNASLALADLPGDSLVRESLEGIELAARRAADLTQQLLAYSGQGDFVLAELDLSKLVGDNIRLLRSVVSKRTRLRTHVDAALPPVEADATHIRQVIMNLVTNASEAGDGGEVDIVLRTGMVQLDASDEEAAEWSDEIVPGRYVFIEVEDNAGGIAADIRDRIFDPFFSTKFTGRGLGLAATLGIVRTHRGVIKVETVPGEGTTFRVQFPAASTDAEAPLDTRPGGEVVLVVDDEELVRKLVVKILKRAGLEAMSARSGEEALEIFADHKDVISAVILDTSLPGMGGAEVFDRLVAARDSVRVIVSSGHSEEVALKGFRAGEHLAAYLQKPFRSEELLDAILNAAA
jgi:CheY-like chemotaxis protein/two-component sensor histidine kinase